MSEKTNQAAVLEEADRFKDLSRCKREPVVKLPLESDSIFGLKWRDTGAAVISEKLGSGHANLLIS